MNTNPLQNPWIVAGLAVAAGGALVYQLTARTRAMKARSSSPGAPAVSLVSQSREQPGGAVRPAAVTVPVTSSWGIDLAFVNQRYPKWLESPNRDPFSGLLREAPTNQMTVTNASDVLQLSAIWRQTGQRLAVINGQVVAEGIEMEGYQIEKIEAQIVRVSGLRGMEEIRMPDFDPMTTNLGAVPLGSVPPRITAGR